MDLYFIHYCQNISEHVQKRIESVYIGSKISLLLHHNGTIILHVPPSVRKASEVCFHAVAYKLSEWWFILVNMWPCAASSLESTGEDSCDS